MSRALVFKNAVVEKSFKGITVRLTGLINRAITLKDLFNFLLSYGYKLPFRKKGHPTLRKLTHLPKFSISITPENVFFQGV